MRGCLPSSLGAVVCSSAPQGLTGHAPPSHLLEDLAGRPLLRDGEDLGAMRPEPGVNPDDRKADRSLGRGPCDNDFADRPGGQFGSPSGGRYFVVIAEGLPSEQ